MRASDSLSVLARKWRGRHATGCRLTVKKRLTARWLRITSLRGDMASHYPSVERNWATADGSTAFVPSCSRPCCPRVARLILPGILRRDATNLPPDRQIARCSPPILSKVICVSAYLNIAALAISFTALIISSFFAVRQSSSAHHSNQLPIINDIFKEIRSSQFREQEESLWESLPTLGQNIGFSQLPKGLRDEAYNVSFTYLMLAYLVSMRILDRRLAVLPIHYRIVRTWEAIEPFVMQEREIRGDQLSFLNLLESFVGFVKRQDILRIVEQVNDSFR